MQNTNFVIVTVIKILIDWAFQYMPIFKDDILSSRVLALRGDRFWLEWMISFVSICKKFFNGYVLSIGIHLASCVAVTSG